MSDRRIHVGERKNSGPGYTEYVHRVISRGHYEHTEAVKLLQAICENLVLPAKSVRRHFFSPLGSVLASGVLTHRYQCRHCLVVVLASDETLDHQMQGWLSETCPSKK